MDECIFENILCKHSFLYISLAHLGEKIVIALKKKGVIHKEVNFLRDGIKKKL